MELCVCVLDITVTLSVALLICLLQFVGYSDEVLDVKFLGKDDSHIVVATNSCQLKVFELLTNTCQILYGHTGQSPAGGSVYACMHTRETEQCGCSCVIMNLGYSREGSTAPGIDSSTPPPPHPELEKHYTIRWILFLKSNDSSL